MHTHTLKNKLEYTINSNYKGKSSTPLTLRLSIIEQNRCITPLQSFV